MTTFFDSKQVQEFCAEAGANIADLRRDAEGEGRVAREFLRGYLHLHFRGKLSKSKAAKPVVTALPATRASTPNSHQSRYNQLIKKGALK